MLQKIIHFSVQQKLVTTFLVCVLIVVGLYQLKKLPIDAVPDITNNQIQVITSAPAYSAIDIERLVTYPIEQANTNIPGLKEIRSFSRFGLSLVTIVFDDKVDVYWARQQVSERLLTLQSVIPAHIGTPVLGPVSSGLSEVYQYVLRPKHGYEQKYTLTELRSLQDWVVRRQLLGVPGVADVSSFGGKLKQYTIEVLPQRLKSYQLSIANIIDAVEKNNENTGGAYIEKGPQVLYIKTEGLAKSVADLEQIVVGTTHMQTPILVKDVAKVTIGEATRYGALTYNDEGEVAGGIVMMLKGANSSTVIEAIKKRVEQIQTTLPKGVVLEPFLDRTKMVNNAISTVKTNLLEGALIVTLVLVLFLGSWRAGLVVASVIPLSLLFAVCLMNLFGVNGNLMSLGALDFGLIVDGAVIIVEATLAYLYTNAAYRGTQLNQNTMNTEVTQAASGMMKSAVFGQLIIVMVYLPIFSLQGIEGKMFKPMAQTVVFALLGAFLLSITYVPMVTSWLISKKIPVKHNKSEEILHALSLWYAGILQKSFLYGKWIVGTAVLLFAGSLYWLSTLGGEFIPTLEEGDFAVDTRVLTGSNLSTTIAYTQRAAGLLKKSFPEVEKVVTKIGSGEIPTDPMPMEASDMMVVLKDKSQWTSATSFDELAQKMSDTLQAVPGITAGFQYPVQMRFNELMTGARQDVVVKLFGENLDTLAHYAATLGKLAANTKGAINVYVEPLNGLPQLAIKFNRSLLAQYHISIADANAVVNASLAGKTVGAVYEDEKRYDAVVRVAKTAKQDEDAIKMLLVPTNTGQQIPLYAIADVVVEKSANQIQREDAKRRIIVGFNVGNSDIATVVNEFQQKVSKQAKLPTGYYITYGGSFENLNAANERLKIAVPAALFLILLLLYFAFGNVKDSLLVFSAIPLSAIGGIAFLALRGLPFSISAAIGFIALFGVAVLNGIVLLTEVKKQIPLQPTLLKALEKAAELRLRPVLMTATVASVGFLPMALSNGSGAEVQRPLATVVIGGIISATLLTLIVLPVLYYLIHTSKRFMPKKIIAVLLCTLSVSAWAQTPENLSKITYQQCVDSALANNALNKAASLNTKATQQQIQSAATIPNTFVNTEYGQYNSAFFDTRLAVQQAINWPSIYGKQKQVLTQLWQEALQQQALTKKILEREIAMAFVGYQHAVTRIHILQQLDSLLYKQWQLLQLKQQNGASSAVEVGTAYTAYNKTQAQLQGLQQDAMRWVYTVQYLTQTQQLYLPDTSTITHTVLLNNSQWQNHPQYMAAQKMIDIQKAQKALEQAKLLPDVLVGYSNTSIRGTGADDKQYTATTRFQAGSIGLGIPIFAKYQRNKIKTAAIQVQTQEQQLAATGQALQQQVVQANSQYNFATSQIQILQKQVALNGTNLVKLATTQLQQGEISFFEWLQIIQQNFDAQFMLTEQVLNQHIAIQQLHYLLSY